MTGVACACEGLLARDAELRFTAAGKAMLGFTLAVDDSFGERKETQWLKVTLFGEQAEVLADRLTKGTRAYVDGKVKLNSWTNKEGLVKSSLECIAFLVQPMGQIGHKRPLVEREIPEEGEELLF